MLPSTEAKSAVPLAIIGMACRLPGADNLDEFWQLLLGGRSAVGELPPDRLEQSLYYDPRKGIAGKTYSKLGAIISSRQFHHERCPIPEEIVRSADLCHLLMCETAADACRHAGLDPFHLPLANTGVFIGHAQGSGLAGDYTYATCVEEAAQFLGESEEFRTLPADQQQAVIDELVAEVRGNLPRRTAETSDIAASGIAGTISRAFGLNGPNLAINSACASSLQAMLVGARALQLGRVDMAIVGGASDCKSDSLVLFAHAQALSATGSRPFDAQADGLICGEGYVCLVLKTLARALSDGDHVLAVVRGLGISSDGRGKSLWAPRQEGQVKAMQRAYRDGLDMSQLQYLEAHATATQLGDATELNTLAAVLKDVVPPGRKIPITSVKANIGHTLESAGIAGVIKVVLAMQHRMIPPAINIVKLNPQIDWEHVPVYVPTSPVPWPDPAPGQPRRAGVNAFGIGGLNMHVVLDEFTEAARELARPASPAPSADDSDGAIAIIGMGCVLPGARNLEKYWELLTGGRDPKCSAPADRWRTDLGYRPGSREPYHSMATLGGFITDFQYDWRAHKLPPKQVAQADPLQFMLLEAADEALKEAGYDYRKLDREGVGVVVGTEFGGDFACQLQMALRLPAMHRILAGLLAHRGLGGDRIGRVQEQFAAALLHRWPALIDETGSFSTSSLASRISKTWDLMGGAATIDAGAASSLAALATSIDMLLCGDCDMMVCAAGQRRMGLPAYEALAIAGLLSASAQPRAPFDAQADGYVPAEGVGVVLLKRLADAVRDGDNIHAVIRGLGAGRDDNLAIAIQQAIRRGLDNAAARPEEIALLETDGVAVPQADQKQIEAVLATQSAAPRRQPLLVGSVIGQIGHAGGASGMASLLKAVLEVEHGKMPPTVGIGAPLPLLVDRGHQVQLALQLSPVAAFNGRKRPMAAVNSCSKDLAYHVILESGTATVAPKSAPTLPAAKLVAPLAALPTVEAKAPMAGAAAPWQIIRVGAASLEELRNKLTAASADTLFAAADRSRFGPADRVRAAIVAANPASLTQKLGSAARTLADPAAWPVLAQQGVFCRRLGLQRPRIAFLFPGQGSQYLGMLRELVAELPAAAAAMQRCSEIMARHGWPILAEIAWTENPQFGTDLFVTQASMLMADAVMLAAIEDLGIRPALVAGHSYGEYPALLAAGVWDVEQALCATRARCDAIQLCPTARGAMLATTAPLETVEELLAALGELVFVANHNAPDQVVVAGAKASLDCVAAALTERSHQCRILPVPSVFHTPLMQGAADSFARALRTFSFAPPCLPLFSSVTNRYLAGSEEVAANLAAQLVTPVRYVDLVQRITSEQDTVLVEVGPQQTLTRLNQKILKGTNAASIASDHPSRPGVEQLYCVRALLECCGALEAKEQPASMGASAKAAPAGPREIVQFDATARRREKMRQAAASLPNTPVTAAIDEPPPAPATVAAQVARVVAGPAGEDLEKFLVNFVVEQTGYPPEVVELDADLEADLGIDSIKKAQLFGELREYFDVTPGENLTLDDFPTLRHVLNYLRGAPTKNPVNDAAPAVVVLRVEPSLTVPSIPVVTVPSVGPPIGEDLEKFLVNFVVEQTGYPPEVVELDANLEADLGIDSIKKAQLFGELREYFDVTPGENLTLDDFPTLRHVLNYLRGAPTKNPAGSAAPTEANAPVDSKPAESPSAEAIAPENLSQAICLAGDPRQMGREHGQQAKEAIEAILCRYADLDGIEGDELLSNSRIAENPTALFSQEELDELDGLADAVDAPQGNLIAHNLAVFADLGSECLQFAATTPGEATVHGWHGSVPVAAALGQCLQPVVQIRRPPSGMPYALVSFMGAVGALGGMNAAGVAITCCANTTGNGRPATRARAALAGVVLQQAENLESAMAILRRWKGQGNWIACLSHAATGRACLVRGDDTSLEVRESIAGLLAEAMPDGFCPDIRARLQATAAGPLDPAAYREALRRLCEPGVAPPENGHADTLSVIFDGWRREVWIRQASGQDAADFTCVPLDGLLEAPSVVRGPEELSQAAAGSIEMAEVEADEELHTQRFMMRLVDGPLKSDAPATFALSGPALVLGNNPAADALRQLLGSQGVPVHSVTMDEDIDAALARFEQLWKQGPIPHLFVLSGRDSGRGDLGDPAAWAEHCRRDVMLPYFLCQRWLQLAGDTRLLDHCTLVMATALGGDFGFSGTVRWPGGGALSGLAKAIWMEYVILRKIKTMIVKIVDAPDDEPPESLAANILRELASGTLDCEVAFVGGRRRLQNAGYQKADVQPCAQIRPGAVWIATGGARGITAASALELGRRFGLHLHLIGTSRPPEIDPAWRNLSAEGLKSLKATIMLQARESGQSAPQAWQCVEKALEMDHWLQAMAAAGVQAKYHCCDVSDPAALARVLDEIHRHDGPIEGILHGAGIDRACRFEKKKREDVLATVASKVDGAYHLMRLTQNDPVAWFIGYGSISGRLGSNGQTDYAMASDMLCKLISWYRTRRPDCRAIGFHWHPWEGFGMAAKPEVQAALVRAGAPAPMSSAEGLRHLLRELYAGGPHSEVLITDWDYHQRFYGPGANETHPDAVQPRATLPAESAPVISQVAQRFVLRAFEAPLPADSPGTPRINGAVCILGDNPEAVALRQRLVAEGPRVHMLAPQADSQLAIAELEELWAAEPMTTLFVTTACDAEAARFDDPRIQARRRPYILLPYLVVQRWYQLLLAMPDGPRGTLVAATHLGGDLGLAQPVAAPEGGMLSGLLKSLWIETNRRPNGRLQVKLVDTPADADPEAVADAICRELAAHDPEIEVGWSGSRRCVIRPVAQPAKELPHREITRGGAWVVTGGARGITAATAIDLARRYSLRLHLIGTTPEPREDAPWRHYNQDELKAFKAQVVREALASGRLPDEAWDPYKHDLEIYANLERFAAGGVKAVYHACDLAEREALARLLNEIRAADGPIRGIIHGAGYGEPARFEFKKRQKIDRTVRGKVEGAINLMTLTRPDPLERFVAFGSLSGRFGGNGLSDYAAANDMLAKLVGWYRCQRPDCPAACLHWQTWANVGMSTKADDVGMVKNELKMEFISPEEGCRHLHEELLAGLPEGEVLITDGYFQKVFYPPELCELPKVVESSPASMAMSQPAAPRRPVRPLIQSIEPRPEGGAVAQIHFDPVADVFLREHRLKGKPFLPGVVGIEALCEAAAALTPEKRIVGLRDVEIQTGLAFHDERMVLANVIVEPLDEAAACTLSTELRDRKGRVIQSQRLHARGVVEFGNGDGELQASPPGNPFMGWIPHRYADDGEGLLYHGGPLRCLKEFWYQYDGGWGKILVPPAAELAGPRSADGWIYPIAVLDACVVTCGSFVFVQFGGALEVPYRFDRLRFGRPPREGETCILRIYFRGREGRHSRFDFTLFGDTDDVLLQADGYQTVLIADGQTVAMAVEAL